MFGLGHLVTSDRILFDSGEVLRGRHLGESEFRLLASVTLSLAYHR